MDTCKSHCCSAYGTGAEGTIAQLVDPCGCVGQEGDAVTSPTKRPIPAPNTPNELQGTPDAKQTASNMSLFSVPTPARSQDAAPTSRSLGWEAADAEELPPGGSDAAAREAEAAEREAAAKESERRARKIREREAKEAREALEAKEARERERRRREEAKEREARDAASRAREAKEREERATRERAELAANAGPLSAPGARLEICLDDGWRRVGDDEFKQVQNQLAGGSAKFSITARGAMYIVDFTDPENPTQANAMTGKSRKLRVVT